MRTIETASLGTITVPEEYEWRIGIGWFRWPKRWASRAFAAAAEIHDIAYDGPWTREHLRRADDVFWEVHEREGGWWITRALVWLLLLRVWSVWTAFTRLKPARAPTTSR